MTRDEAQVTNLCYVPDVAQVFNLSRLMHRLKTCATWDPVLRGNLRSVVGDKARRHFTPSVCQA